MLDALRKRCEFVDAAAGHAGLTNVSTLWMRAEDAGQDPTLREVTCATLYSCRISEVNPCLRGPMQTVVPGRHGL